VNADPQDEARPASQAEEQRRQMVERQLAARGIRSPEVLEAMAQVPREQFVPDPYRHLAYADTPLPIGHEQTISQPYIVALMIDALDPRPGDTVLEIGGGSGYAAAVISRIVAQVYSVERLQPLCDAAQATLDELGYANVRMVCADGTTGHAEAAPYQGILVAAGGPEIPRSLKAQLALGGRLVIPVGSERTQQSLIRVTRTEEDEFEVEHITEVRFVPLIGSEGWH
jgi:protein-L-isoaspartate(D-aspartate) O-methyltransferase